jgi:hypothetical protein
LHTERAGELVGVDGRPSVRSCQFSSAYLISWRYTHLRPNLESWSALQDGLVGSLVLVLVAPIKRIIIVYTHYHILSTIS